MSKVMFMPSVQGRLGQGPFFRSKFALLVRVMAILLALGVLMMIINMWRGGLTDAPGSSIFAALLFQLFLIVGTYMAVHAMFVRATEIGNLLEGTYTVIPIASVFLKMLGEVYASLMIAVTIGGMFATWIKGVSPRGLLRDFEMLVPSSIALIGGIENAFFAGLAFLAIGVVAALLWLFFFYLLSEIVLVLGDVGTSARRRV